MKKKNVSIGFPALLAGIASLALLFAGCSPDPEPDPDPSLVPGGCTVSFNANGGSPAPQAQQVSAGGLVTEPAPMTKAGHSLDGWFKEANFVSRWDFAKDTVTADITLYAQWIPSITSVDALSAYLAAQSGETSKDAPLTAAVGMELSATDWSDIMSAIQTAGKYVALNLAACAKSTHSSGGGLYADGTFNPNNAASTGKDWIVRLVLPDAAASIAAETYGATFTGFTSLKSVSGAGVTDIGKVAFYGCTSLTNASFPKATSIGEYAFADCSGLTSVSSPKAATIGDTAFENCSGLTSVSFPQAATIGTLAFYGCTSLTSVSLPVATSIGEWAFALTGTAALSVTLGSTAPKVGKEIFYKVEVAKAVTVKYPAGASGYGTAPANTTTNNWGNAFRGKGWDGSSYLTGDVNDKITLKYEQQ